MWQQPLFQANHKHDRKLQPLSRVHSHHRHSPATLLQCINVGSQSRLLQIVFQVPLRILKIILGSRGYQLINIVNSRLVVATLVSVLVP